MRWILILAVCSLLSPLAAFADLVDSQMRSNITQGVVNMHRQDRSVQRPMRSLDRVAAPKDRLTSNEVQRVFNRRELRQRQSEERNASFKTRNRLSQLKNQKRSESRRARNRTEAQ